MKVYYSYGLKGKDYYRVLWRGQGAHVYIPSGLENSVFKRNLLAQALQMLRTKRHRDEAIRNEKVRARERWEKKYPMLNRLNLSEVASSELTDGKLELWSNSYESGLCEFTAEETLRLAQELQDIANKMQSTEQ